MTDDLKERLLELCNGHPNTTIPWPHRVIHDALAYITDLEAKLQRLGREMNLAKYGEPDFAWEIHKNAVTDLEARLAAAEAGEDALAEAVRRQIAFEAWWKTIGGVCPEPLVDAPIRLRSALAAYEARRKE